MTCCSWSVFEHKGCTRWSPDVLSNHSALWFWDQSIHLMSVLPSRGIFNKLEGQDWQAPSKIQQDKCKVLPLGRQGPRQCRKSPAGSAQREMGTDLLRRGCGTRICSTRGRYNFRATAQEHHGEGGTRLCSALHCGKTRGDHTLKPEGFRLGTGKHFLPVSSVRGETGCLERLYSLHPWSFSRPIWTKPWATWSGLMVSPGGLDKSTPGVPASLNDLLVPRKTLCQWDTVATRTFGLMFPSWTF